MVGLIIKDAESSYGVQVNLQIPAGQCVAIMGASGAGKSTLLNMLAGFTPLVGGQISIGSKDCSALPPYARPIGCMFQEHNLFPHLSVFANVALGIRPSLKLTAAEQARVMQAICDVGLQGTAERIPATLSGGQRQRAAIARMLVREVKLMLFDEPFSQLDPGLCLEMLQLLKVLNQERALTMLVVTHQPQVARVLCTHTAFLAGGQVIDYGPTAAILHAGRSLQLREYLGESELVAI